MTVDVEKLREQATVAAQRAADAAARVEAAAAAESAERERRAREWDTRLVDSFDEAVAREHVAAALRRVHEAVATGDDPFAAWLTYQVEHRRFWHAAMDARAAAARLGRAVGTSLLPSVHEDFDAVLRVAVSREAARRVDDELDQLHAQRECFISGTTA